MKVAVVGTRTVKVNEGNIKGLGEMLSMVMNGRPIDYLVSGGAKGADTLAYRFAKKYGLGILVLFPDWERYGRAAGMIRNDEIVKNADIVVALWDGESRGTGNTVDTAKKMKKELHIFYEDEIC